VCAANHFPAFLQVFSESDFETFMHSDDEILRSAHARWMLLSERAPTCETVDATSTIEAKGVYIEQSPLAIGTAAAPATSVVSGAGSSNGLAAVDASLVPDLEVSGPNVAAEHARVWKDSQGDCWVQDLPSSSGIWVNGKLVKKGDKIRLMPQVSMAVLAWLLCWRSGCCQHGVFTGSSTQAIDASQMCCCAGMVYASVRDHAKVAAMRPGCATAQEIQHHPRPG
jgi:hypothetical protein